MRFNENTKEIEWCIPTEGKVKAIIESERDIIIEQFANFTFMLHEKGVDFKDFSGGNILIKRRSDGSYMFYLVDLNRMKFHRKIGFKGRMKNLSRIMRNRKDIEDFSRYYAVLYGKPYEQVLKKLLPYIKRHEIYAAVMDSTRKYRHILKRK